MGVIEAFKILGRFAIDGTDEAGKKLRNVSGDAENSANAMTRAFKKIGGAIATYFTVDAIVNFGKACVNAAADVSAEAAAFSQIMGGYSDEASEKLLGISDATGIMEGRLKGHMTSLTAKFKGLGYDITDATTLASNGLMLAADGAAFWDMSLDESVSHLNSFINGSYEGGEAIGLFANDTQMAMYAVEQGLIKNTKKWANLDEKTKQATRLEYAQNMYKLSGATGQAAKESGSYLNVQGNLTEAWRQFQATAGEPILENIVIPAMQKIAEILPVISEKIGPIAEKFVNLGTDIGEFWNDWILPTIKGFVRDLGVAKDNLQPVIDLVKNFITELTGGANGFDLLRYACRQFELAMDYLGSIIAETAAEITNFILWLQAGSTEAEVLKAIIVAVTAAFVTWKASMLIQDLISNVVSGIKNMITTFKTLWATLMANPITLIIAAIAALVAGFVYLWNNCEGFRNFWIGLWDKIVEYVNVAINWVVNAFNVVVDFVKNNWQALLLMLVNPFAGAFKLIYDNCEGFRNFVNNFLAAVKTFFVNAWTTIKTKTAEVWNAIKTTTTNIWNGIKTAISNAWTAIKTAVSNAITNVKTKVTTIWNNIKTTTSTIWTNIRTAISTAWTNIKTSVTNAINNVKTTVTNIWNSIRTTTSNVWNGIKSSISNVWNGIKSSVSSVINGVKSTISSAWDSVKSTTSSVWNGVKSTISNAIEGAKTKVSNVINAIKGLFTGATFSWPKIPLPHFGITPSGWKAGDLLQGVIPKLGISWYAKGGILDKPTIFGISGNTLLGGGEAGKEAVAPINTLQEYVRSAVRSELGLMESYMLRIMQTVDKYLPEAVQGRNVVLDTGALVGAMGSNIDVTMGNINRRKERWG